MPILTNFLKLLKPEKNDYVDVEKHISENYDKIDNKMEELSSSNDEKLNKGNVSSEYDTAKKIEDKIKTAQGTADNKLNKGNLPTTITDAKEIYDLLENNSGLNFDKNLLFLNDKGVKTQGKIYFDRNKVGMFECIKTTPEDYVANSTTYFVDISNKSSSDRLSNLYNFKETVVHNSKYNFDVHCYEINNHILICSFKGGGVVIPSLTDVLIKVPSGYKNMTGVVSGNFGDNKPLEYFSNGNLFISSSEGELTYKFFGQLVTFK